MDDDLMGELMKDVPIREIRIPPDTMNIRVTPGFGGGYTLVFTSTDLGTSRESVTTPAAVTFHPDGTISWPVLPES
jgi:hypothetical protein